MRLTRLDLARVFWRSLFIQAGFNFESMQSLGLVYSLLPALQRLYPDDAKRQQAVQGHLGTFNTHPYVSAAIVGGILFHEERAVSGEAPAGKAEAFKRALMGPLAAIGDGFFWRSLLPAVGAVSCALAPWLGAWAALVFVISYNLIHLSIRARLFWLGYTLGDALVPKLSAVQLPRWGARLRAVAAAASGGLGAWLAARFGDVEGGVHEVRYGLVAASIGVVATVLVAKRVSPYWVLYGSAAAAFAAGAMTDA